MDNIAKVLILSDCAAIDAELDSFFMSEQIKTEWLRSSDEYFLFVEQTQPDMILLSHSFPKASSPRFIASLRKAARDKYLPIIALMVNLDLHLSAQHHEEAYLKSLSAGINELITLPSLPQIMRHKLNASMQFSCLERTNDRVTSRLAQEEYLADKLVLDNIDARNFGLDKIDYLHIKAHEYRKDFYLCAQSPNGDMNVLLGNFSGFDSALTFIAIPLAEAFRTMTTKGFKLINIITQINQLLYELLPNDVFFSASVMNLSSQKKRLRLFNASAPDILVFSQEGDVKHRCTSMSMPLGVLPQMLIDTQIDEVDIELTDRVIFYTQGLLTLLNSHEQYRQQREKDTLLISLIQKGFAISSIKEEVLAYLSEESSELHFEHDLTLIDLPCCDIEDLLMLSDSPDEHRGIPFNHHEKNEADWEVEHRISGRNLNRINPIPLLLNVIQDSGGDGEHVKNIYTILTELYDNALLHGILKIKTHALYQSGVSVSRLKSQLKDKIETGFININIKYYDKGAQGAYIFNLTDSGNGFDFKNFFNLNAQLIAADEVTLGRGIELVEQLCEHMIYHDKGNSVEAIYLFNH